MQKSVNKLTERDIIVVMDKYTVDLDKVLNDFEYSELTENNGYSANSSNQGSAPLFFSGNGAQNQFFTPPITNHKPSYTYDSSLPVETYPKIASTPKHSINNVFHSLNEYLNSDIKTDLDTPCSSFSNLNEIEANAPTLVRKEKIETSIQDIFKNITKDDISNSSSEVKQVNVKVTSEFISNNLSENFPSVSSDIKNINNNVNSEVNLNSSQTSNLSAENTENSILEINANQNGAENTSENTLENFSKTENLIDCEMPESNFPDNKPEILTNKNETTFQVKSNLSNETEHNLNSTLTNLDDKTVKSDLSEAIVKSNLPQTELKTLKSNLTDSEKTSELQSNLSLTGEEKLKSNDSGENSSTQTKSNFSQTSNDDGSQTKSNFSHDLSMTQVSQVKSNLSHDLSMTQVSQENSLAQTQSNVSQTSNDDGSQTKSNLSHDLSMTQVSQVKSNLENIENIKEESNDENQSEVSQNINSNIFDDNSQSQIKSIKPIGFDEFHEISDSEMENELAKLEAEYKMETDNKFQETETNVSETKVSETNLKSELENASAFKVKNIESVIENVKTDVNKIISNSNLKDEIKYEEITENERNENKFQEISKKITAQELKSDELGASDIYKGDSLPKIDKITSQEKLISDFKKAQENDPTSLKNVDRQVSEEKLEQSELRKANFQIAEENARQREINEKIAVNAEASELKIGEIQDMPEKSGKEEKRNSILLRPNSLDLNSEASNDTPTINLIGAPGSTPYNNVYTETHLRPEKNSQNTQNTQTSDNLDVENDPNQSLSPTLSDASTFDNSDSPNTSDSCNDTSLDEHCSDQKDTKNDKNIEKKNNSDRSTEGENSDEPKPSNSQGSGDGNNLVNEGFWLGKTAPFWTPDSDTVMCLHCSLKFTVIKRRHHCRACGLVLCSKCCNMKYKLEYMNNTEARVCLKCYEILTKDSGVPLSSGSDNSPESRENSPQQSSRLNPNNPMEYCSTVPPLQQVANVSNVPPTVMVPVGVLKRNGSGKSRSGKSVMFCDGIRPGCDLTELDYDFNYKESHSSGSSKKPTVTNPPKSNRNLPKIDTKTSSYIPSEDNSLPPIVNVLKSDIYYADCSNNNSVVEMLRNETITFAIQRNFHIKVKIINMDCCINKQAWCFSTDGMIAVGQDELVILLEFIDNEKFVPKDVFLHLNNIYNDAIKGTSITEMGLSIHNTSNFLESKNHAGFLYTKPTFQCIQNLVLPNEPYLIGILIHRWETPWAKIFPLRLLLRLGAEYRYYPSPIISTRHRESVYVEIGHTIINLLADFRNFSYTLPSVRGLTIHMEEKNTTVSIPINRYDQVMKALNNSSDHILAFAANFSSKADSHLVCIQDTHGNNENAYTTHAINIHNKPRKVTGASFIVLNGALKSTSGLTAKSSIVEDGLMIQILPEQMVKLRNSLRNMKDFKINCGCVNAQSDEFVNILWTENDVSFNVGVVSPIDNMSLAGIPSIRVHNGRDYVCNSGNKMIRWTEVFIIQSGEESTKTQDPVDISKISENISKATCQALVKYLDLLATNSFLKIGIRSTLHVENVSYLAGSNSTKLPPIYMKSLDNELIPVLHKITSNNFGETAIVVELIFHILNM